MGPTHTFRTHFARLLTIAAAGVIGIVAVFSLIEGGTPALWQALPFLVVGGGLTWVVFGNPKVEVSDGGVTVVNMLRRVHVPWPTLRGVESRWSLTMETSAGKVSSWAIPATSGTANRMRTVRRRRASRREPDANALETGNDAAAVALVIAQRLEALTQAGHLDDAPTYGQVEPSTTWNAREVVVLGVAVLVVLVMVLTD